MSGPPKPAEGSTPASRAARIARAILLVTLAASIGYAALRLANAPAESTDPSVRVQSDYVLMLIQCAGGIIVMFLPAFVDRRFGIRVPGGMQVAYFAFLYGAIYLGEVRGFYYRFPNWDTVLHFFSGAMLGALGFLLVRLLNDADNRHVRLSPEFVAFFAFCFAVACGVVWEIYEWTVDGLAGTNMQKVVTDTGEVLVGRAALADTMEDLIVDTLAALTVTLVGYLDLRRRSARTPPAVEAQDRDTGIDANADAAR
ncbi:hypothetical protein [Propionicimonas sp.]|uniref:hypothetical protein n=1 Tax=Propionicimonas sp. TaxID=1955623 RepID=UPI0039E4267B